MSESKTNSSSKSDSESNTNSSYNSDTSSYLDITSGDEHKGCILNGRYILLHKIGIGAFSSVWLGYYINDPNKIFYYALKVQNQDDYNDGLKEINILEKIKKLILSLNYYSCHYTCNNHRNSSNTNYIYRFIVQ